MTHEHLSDMGKNAEKYYNQNFERSYLLDKAENILESMRFPVKYF